MGKKEESGFSVDLGNTQIAIWGWVFGALAVAIALAALMLTAALSTGILFISGGIGGGLFVVCAGKATAGIIDAKARRDYLRLRGNAEILAARKGTLPVHVDYKLLQGRKND